MRKQARGQSEGGEENLETQVWRMGVVKDTDQRERAGGKQEPMASSWENATKPDQPGYYGRDERM